MGTQYFLEHLLCLSNKVTFPLPKTIISYVSLSKKLLHPISFSFILDDLDSYFLRKEMSFNGNSLTFSLPYIKPACVIPVAMEEVSLLLSKVNLPARLRSHHITLSNEAG